MGEPLLEDHQIREYVGEYIKTHFSELLKGEESRLFVHSRNEDTLLLERMVRVEEGLKNIQIQVDRNFEFAEKRFEQIDKRFEQVDKRFDELIHQMDKRFEQVDKRFEQVDKRFTQMFTFMTLGFLMITTLMSVYQFII